MRKRKKADNCNEQLEQEVIHRRTANDNKKDINREFARLSYIGVITFIAIISFTVIGTAWFISLNKVSIEGMNKLSPAENTFSLATLESDMQGVYDNSANGILEKVINKYWRTNKTGRDDENNLYSSFTNLPVLRKGQTIFTDTKGDRYILGDEDGISLQVNANSNVNNIEEFGHVGPGSFGKITFYVIPHIDYLNTVKFSVSLKPFLLEGEEKSDGTGTIGNAVPIENTEDTRVLLKMLQGHIMLFEEKEDGNYTKRIIPTLKEDGTITFEFEKDKNSVDWKKDTAEPISFYWIWPRRFENIKYPGQEESMFTSECEAYSELLNWMNENRTYIVNEYEITDWESLKNPSEDMNNNEFSYWSTGYNKGDQLIGENIAFVQWDIEAE